MLWRVVRRLLAIGIRLLIWRPIVSLTIVAVALGVAGFAIGGPSAPDLLQGRVASTTAAPGTGQSPGPIATVRASSSTAPPPAVDEYISGMTSFNAQLMWDALDPQAVQTMASQGESEQVLQQNLDQVKQKGARYDSVAFVGGYPLNNGDSYLFYVVTRRGFATDSTGRGVADQVFFVFTVGPNGKILQIH